LVTVWSEDKDGLNPEVIGETVVVPNQLYVVLNRGLSTEDHVWVIQTMCEQQSERQHAASVSPGTKRFTLTKLLSQLSKENMAFPVILKAAEVICAFNGDWSQGKRKKD
jgi:hypothetical protein